MAKRKRTRGQTSIYSITSPHPSTHSYRCFVVQSNDSTDLVNSYIDFFDRGFLLTRMEFVLAILNYWQRLYTGIKKFKISTTKIWYKATLWNNLVKNISKHNSDIKSRQTLATKITIRPKPRINNTNKNTKTKEETSRVLNQTRTICSLFLTTTSVTGI